MRAERKNSAGEESWAPFAHGASRVRVAVFACVLPAACLGAGACSSGGEGASEPSAEAGSDAFTGDAWAADGASDATSEALLRDSSSTEASIDASLSDDANANDSGVEADAVGADASPDAAVPLDARYFDSNIVDDDIFRVANPDPGLINIAALDALLATAQAQATDSIVLALGDTIVAEHYYKGSRAPVSVQSVSKSLVSLAIGILIDEGKIASISVPVSTYFPEWATGPKASVTIGNLLAMTSGMTDDPSGAFFSASDRLGYARARAVTGTPGTFAYSDTAVMLFSGIVQAASGMALDAFVNDRIFSKIGIADGSWAKDPAGNVIAPGGLYLSPRSMLRVGRLVRNGGTWNGTVVVSAAWVGASSTQPSGSQCYSYLWWLGRSGCSPSTPLFATPGPIESFYAAGWGGNYVNAVPSKGLVEVRMKDAATSTYEVMKLTAFEAFPGELVKVAP